MFWKLSTGECLATTSDNILSEKNSEYSFQELLEKVFQSIDYSSDEVETNNSDATEFEREEHDFLRDEILDALRQKETQVSLQQLTNILTGDIDEHMTWILEVAATTLSKLLQALYINLFHILRKVIL